MVAATMLCVGVPLTSSGAQTPPTPSGNPAATVATAPTLPDGVNEVVKMYQAGVGKDVILNYIKNTPQSYYVDADGIIYLRDVGLPQDIVNAMIRRDGELRQQALLAERSGQYAYAANQPVAQVPTPTTPPPEVSDWTDYPTYDYGYPYYDYPHGYGYPYYGYGYGWPIIVGGGGGVGAATVGVGVMAASAAALVFTAGFRAVVFTVYSMAVVASMAGLAVAMVGTDEIRNGRKII